MARAGRHYGGVSAVDRRSDRREKLIRAAVTVYGACGYRQATVAAVCREAGLTPRYFYEAFANSELLLAAAFDAVVDVMIAEVREAGARVDGRPTDRMCAMLVAYYGLLRREPQAARVFLIEIGGVSAGIDAAFARSVERFADLVAGVLGGDGPADPLLRAGATYGLLHIARAWIESGYHEPVDRVAQAALPLCVLLADGAPILPRQGEVAGAA